MPTVYEVAIQKLRAKNAAEAAQRAMDRVVSDAETEKTKADQKLTAATSSSDATKEEKDAAFIAAQDASDALNLLKADQKTARDRYNAANSELITANAAVVDAARNNS